MTTNNNNIEFPKSYYEAAGQVADVRNRLNTSFSDYDCYFWTGDDIQAKESIEKLRSLINLRERQVEMARKALAAYEAEVKQNGPRKYNEFITESFNRQRAEAEVA